ncbi:4-hydroxy-2-oxo-heptane-1,7-dioate aldolase, partial [Salmonella enterica subsp. enterica serovar Meleagridis]|nr:4-hydroxy-2-oxo-heptane-1,7-dioate aldolase [Salmonella enterica subsp. enterica serovar Meleagridis]
ALAQKKNCPVRPASIKPGPVSVALPGNRSTLQNSHQRKKNERHIICTSGKPRVCQFAQRAQHGSTNRHK